MARFRTLVMHCLLLLTAARGQHIYDYCLITPQHTMCQFQGPSHETCGKVVTTGVTQEHVDEITRLHNKFRLRIALGAEERGNPGPQPPAANMMKMNWDWELAAVAQRWALQCVFRHDCNDCRRVGRFWVGQNIFYLWQDYDNDLVDWKMALTSLYDEVEMFNNSWVRSYAYDFEVGHYTQMTWWESSLVGCGFTSYKSEGLLHKLYVCNYGPAGNTLGASMYQVGLPCTRCPTSTTCSKDFPGLCTNEVFFTDEQNS